MKYTHLDGNDASAVQVELTIAGHRYTASGGAKRRPEDMPDPEIGELIAAERALRRLAKQLRAASNRKLNGGTNPPSGYMVMLGTSRHMRDMYSQIFGDGETFTLSDV